MASGNHGQVLRDLGRIFEGGSLVGLSDGQLLRRFAAGDEGAFETLVSRCGPTVLGVCRRLLRDPGDVEDAFQATFLVLLRKGGGLRDPEAIGPWLHGVAHRVAARIRVRAARRPECERRGARPEAAEVESAWAVERDELRRLIEDEIGRLPEKYRRPVVLCYVEGRTHEEAARRLRCTAGSLRGRLDRARRKLQERLARRGVAPAIGLGAVSSLSEAAVPAPLVSATVATLSRVATASAAAGSMRAIELADGVFRAMGVVRLKVAAAVMVMVMAGLVAAGAISMLAAREPVQQDAGRNGASPPVRDENVARGRVLDDQGRPIAGARVASGSDLRGVASVPEAVTDADGRFVMQDIPRGPIVLTAQAPGRAPDLRVINPGPEMSRVEFRLGPGHTIRGRVVDAHGKPIAGAPISADEWRGHHSLRWSTRTDADGRFRWDEAPGDGVLIDLGQLGFDAKRYWRASPDQPERTIRMRRPLRVRGRVTDAATGRPITRFTLVPGYTWSGSEAAQWENNRAREITGLSYDVTLSTVISTRLVRVEAPGYLPAVSRVLKDDEEEAVVHFALRRGEGFTGVVRAPDGSPLAGVEVALARFAEPANIQNGRFQQGVGQPRIVRAGADGRFVLEPSGPPFAIVALHDRGFATRTFSDRAKPAPVQITLEPWGRIEGMLKIGRQPGGEQTLSLECNDMSVLSNGINWSNFTTTDARGRFTLDRIVPGRVHISRHISLGEVGSAGGNPSLVVDVRPGETTRLTVGGTGRAVVGKVEVPDELVGRKDWTHGLGYLHPSRAGAGPDSTARSIVFKAEADGSFRIDDVAAGTYLLTLPIIKKPSGSPGGFFGADWIAKATREVVVPAMPGGRSDEPLDIGTINVEPAEHPAAPTGVKRP